MSELKTILVHLDAAPNGTQRLQLAQRLAQMHRARIEVLYAVLPTVLQFPYAFAGDAQAASMLMAFETEQRDRARAGFERERKASAGPGLAEADWHETSDEPLRAMTQRAWAADLLLLAQHDPDPKACSGLPPDFAAAVLIDSGKPGLVMPYIGAGPMLGQSTLIAWKPTAEAARAVTAALPLLQRTQKVHVAVWDEASAPGAAPPAVAIEPYLRNHGIAAIVHRCGRPGHDLGGLLLSLAADLQADMLVMGCYGHGRAREWLLGGVTRSVLQSMTLPVLMAH
jgi:nucleotide-binding universal stress UspA family protein